VMNPVVKATQVVQFTMGANTFKRPSHHACARAREVIELMLCTATRRQLKILEFTLCSFPAVTLRTNGTNRIPMVAKRMNCIIVAWLSLPCIVTLEAQQKGMCSMLMKSMALLLSSFTQIPEICAMNAKPKMQ